MKKRHKHEKTSKKPMILINIILFLTCIIAGTMLFFTLKESHLILSAEKTEQISKNLINKRQPLLLPSKVQQLKLVTIVAKLTGFSKILMFLFRF